MTAWVERLGCVALLTFVSAAQSVQPAPSDLLSKGKELYSTQGPKPALLEFQKAFQMFQANKDQHGEAVTLGYMANCYRRLGELDDAIDFASRALRMKEDLQDEGEIGKTHNQLGLIYWERADYPNAIQHFQDAISIAEKVTDKELEGSARNNLGLVYDERGEFDRSLEQYKRALDLHRATRFERGEGDTLGNIGGVYFLLGRFREALPYYQQALEISERLGLKPASSDDLGNIALCLAAMGDIDGALKNFDQALQVAHETGLTKEEADWRKGKGTTLVGLGRFDAALREYAAAEQVYEHAGLKRELAEALLDTGYVYELLGDRASAESHFGQALQVARKISNQSSESSSLMALGDLERRRRRNDAADSYFDQALGQSRAAKNDGATVALLLHRAMNDIDRKNYELALQLASDACAMAERDDNRPAQALSQYVSGEAERLRNRFQVALDRYTVAQELQLKLRDPELGWRILYGRGQALAALNQTDQAITSYREAIALIENTRGEISEERYRAGYMDDRYQVYVALVELFLKLQKLDQAFFYSEKLRSRVYFDQLGAGGSHVSEPPNQQRLRELGEQIRSLRRSLQKEYDVPQEQRRGEAVELYSSELSQAEREYQALLDSSHPAPGITAQNASNRIPPIEDVQRRLPKDAALLEFVVGKQTLSILLIKPTSVVGVPVQVTSDNLASRTELLRDLIAGRRADWMLPARGLRKLILDPLQAPGYLAGIRELVIVPDGVLNYVPFAALPLSGQRFLGDQYTIAYLPAAAAFIEDKNETGRKLLALAPSNAHLPNAMGEARTIGQIFGPTSRVVVGREATKTLFKQIAGEYDYLHLATHGSLNRNAPWLSVLQLEPDKESDGRLELYEVAAMKLHARLITLSACETGLGEGYFAETPGGDEFVGLTRAFLGAGGQSVLASLWAVNDEASRDLMIRFYRHLLASGSAEALAKAQKELRHEDARFAHPYYWAAFVVSGSIN